MLERKWEKKKKKLLQKQNSSYRDPVIYFFENVPNIYLIKFLYLSTYNLSHINNYTTLINKFNLTTILFNIQLYSTQFLINITSQKQITKAWKYRTKNLNKLKSLKSLKKLIIHKKYNNNSISFIDNFEGFFKRKHVIQTPSLVDRAPLTQRVVETSYLELFYKLNKEGLRIEHSDNYLSFKDKKMSHENDLTIFLRNYHKKPYWKLRLSRIIHWDFFFKSKTIREQRYKSFAPKFLKKQQSFTNIAVYFVIFFTNIQISWIRAQKLIVYLKEILIRKASNSVYFLPIILSNIVHWKFICENNIIKKKIINRWSYLKYKHWQFPWLQKKKNFPKIIKHIQPNIEVLKKLTHYDTMTGYLLFFYEVKKFQLSFTECFKVNFSVKIHMYRYNSN